MQDDHVGVQIKAWRRRRGGMTQQVLADLAGLSQAYISQIENGHSTPDRRSTLVAIAGALNISVAQLIGARGNPDDPLLARATSHVPAIRAALVEISAGERRTRGRDRDTLTSAVAQATSLRNAADYAALAPLLPDLLRDLYAHDGDMAGASVEVLFATRYALKTMGYPDLALIAARIGVDIAREHGDPVWIGQAVYSLVQAFPAESAGLGAQFAASAADELQASDTRGGQEVYGCLHILAGYHRAITGQAQEAVAHLDEAADVAARLGEPRPYGPLLAGWNGNWFGPTQVEYWRIAVAAELGDASTALAVHERLDPTVVPVPNRHVYMETDLARALASAAGEAQDRAAMHALARAERAAPQHFRFNPTCRDLVQTLIRRSHRRAVTGSLADLARKLGLDAI